MTNPLAAKQKEFEISTLQFIERVICVAGASLS